MNIRQIGGVLAAGALALATVACGDGTQPAAEPGKLPVAVSTNVWGSVVSAIGGDKVEVKAIIDDPGADPHSYQSSAEDAATVQRAKLVLYNGGGYDDFFTQMAEQAPNAKKLVAFDISGKATAEPPAHEEGHEHEHGHEGHEHGAVNEHVWYDLPTVGKVADQVAGALGELQPADKAQFDANAAAFRTKLGEVTRKVTAIGEGKPERKVIATEPVAHYLLEAAKLTDATPPDFAKAIEEESEVPAAAKQQALQLVTGKQVQAVVNNMQTITPVTQELVDKARSSGLPVVDVTETLPDGQGDYIAWMTSEVDELARALGS
ncbi:metal ABC transporter solute-binding protein, Zn/Mn family [Amycolatopsis suaedae]|uniref:Metal ABC transporter substrate-binding protein n=1 Tax=Amycolatopsis suaedae TaxID=2510978 RepID=A0A4V2ELI3_9PSEU|nr:zinc ABC transporter substrate-binding protein [Amycolatopsis suaedae]RZQ61665.1 metal ABC transporter substrate-binding protein [Amycolatopsis suaedae]